MFVHGVNILQESTFPGARLSAINATVFAGSDAGSNEEEEEEEEEEESSKDSSSSSSKDLGLRTSELPTRNGRASVIQEAGIAVTADVLPSYISPDTCDIETGMGISSRKVPLYP